MTSTKRSPILPTIMMGLALTGCGDGEDSLQQQASQPATQQEAIPTPEPPAVDAGTAARLAAVRRALDQGMEVDRANENGSTALMMAAFDGYTEVVELLLDRGAEIDRRDAAGRTALMYAASGPFPETVAVLLERGANPDLADSGESWTALMFAAGEGHSAVVDVLLRHGADPALQDADGDTAADHATNRGNPGIAALIEANL